jgi:hypothetical protein
MQLSKLSINIIIEYLGFNHAETQHTIPFNKLYIIYTQPTKLEIEFLHKKKFGFGMFSKINKKCIFYYFHNSINIIDIWNVYKSKYYIFADTYSVTKQFKVKSYLADSNILQRYRKKPYDNISEKNDVTIYTVLYKLFRNQISECEF